MDIIGGIIFFWIIYKIIKTPMDKKETTKPNQPRNTYTPVQQTDRQREAERAARRKPTAVPNQHANGRANPVPNTPSSGSLEERRKQAELKKALQEKHGAKLAAAKKKTVPANDEHLSKSVYAEAADERGDDDILTMANAQVDKQHRDDQARILKEAGKDRKVASFGYSREKTDSMKKVQDLMITGYSGDLNFKRDFIAEGVEMMNRFADTKYIEN